MYFKTADSIKSNRSYNSTFFKVLLHLGIVVSYNFEHLLKKMAALLHVLRSPACNV